MRTGKWRKGFALLVAFMLPCSIMAAESHNALLYATNSVMVNGLQISKTSAIFPGDKLAVPVDSTATIMLKGTSILLPKLTTLTFAGDSVLLDHQAAVSVDTTAGMAIQISDIKISPEKTSAKYQVGRYNGQIVVAAKQGSLLIAGASGSHVLAEGKTTSMPDPEPQKPGSVPATTGAGVGEVPTWVAVVIGVAAAGAAAGAAIATTGTPSSNVHP